MNGLGQPVTLTLTGGKEAKLSLASLSPASQERARKLAGQTPPAKK